MRLPALPAVDRFSFWLGFAAALLLCFLLYRFRAQLAGVRAAALRRLRRFTEFLTSGTERAWREDVLRDAQTGHLAGSFLALDEILLPPRLLLLPAPFDPTAPPPELDLNDAIPVMPDWPDMAAIYQAPSLSAAEAVRAAAPLLVLGGPGSGKTTLLAHLASAVARGDTSLFGEDYTPVFVHAADLALPTAPGGDIVHPLVAAAQARATTLTAARLPRHLSRRLRESPCAILIDGLDQLPPGLLADTAAWLGQFMQSYKQHRLVATAGTSGYGPLLRLGFAPVLLAPWTGEDYRALTRKWGEVWDRLVRVRRTRGAADTDLHLLLGWLSLGNQGRTIFEVTLKTWAAFAGDARGKRPVDWLEAYVLRHGVKPLGFRGLGRLAAAMLEREQNLGLSLDEAEAMLETLFAGPAAKSRIDAHDFLDDLMGRGLLARHRDRVTFRHSLVAAYCAATAAANEPEFVAPGETAGWVRALYFFSSLGDLAPLVARQLGQAPDLLHTGLMACAHWIRDAPAAAHWRSDILRQLSRLLTDSASPSELRLRALGAFVAAGDPAVAALFKQGLTHEDPLLRQIGALGLGTLGEHSAALAIEAQFADPLPEVRWAAALALGAMNHSSASDALGTGMLNGDEELRRACAEALARDVETGHALLKEAIVHADLSVRRAAVYGLAATGAPWAIKVLEDVQINEKQWFVRSAAQDVLARLGEADRRSPRPYAPPESQGWLIAWAARQGLGVPPGDAAIEVLYDALADGDEPTQRAAADALGRLGQPTAAPELYRLMRGANTLLRDTAFNALAQIAAASGERLAAPMA
jgi:HEAT repeat protein